MLTVKEAAERLGVSRTRINNLLIEKRFPSVCLCECGNSYLISEEDVKAEELKKERRLLFKNPDYLNNP
jgi:excisionase family DNA binding protein